MLATHLPPDAAVWRVGPDDVLWSRETQQIASLRDDLRGLLLGDKAKPVPRPSDPHSPAMSVEDKAEAFLARQKARKQATVGR